MVNQTKINGEQQETTPVTEMGRNVSDLTHDLLTLIELQFQLFAKDFSETSARSIRPIVLLAAAALLAFGAIPVVLFAAGRLLAEFTTFSEGGAFLTISGAAIIAAVGLGWWGVRQLLAALNSLQRSRNELSRNYRWLRDSLKQHPSGQTSCKTYPKPSAERR